MRTLTIRQLIWVIVFCLGVTDMLKTTSHNAYFLISCAWWCTHLEEKADVVQALEGPGGLDSSGWYC